MDWKRKLSSRKFWALVADFVGALLIALKMEEGSAAQITALIVMGGGVIAYIFGEAIADAGNGTVTVNHVYPKDETKKPPDVDSDAE